MSKCLYANGYVSIHLYCIEFIKETNNIALVNEQVNVSRIYERGYKNKITIFLFSTMIVFLFSAAWGYRYIVASDNVKP